MHALILSCNTGAGHNSAASAVVESMHSHGHTGERVDFLALEGEKVSELVSSAYVGVVKDARCLRRDLWRGAGSERGGACAGGAPQSISHVSV